jgi:hypothetical protein
MINELLYKSESAHAHELMRKDPAVFNEVCELQVQIPCNLSLIPARSVPHWFPESSTVMAKKSGRLLY